MFYHSSHWKGRSRVTFTKIFRKSACNSVHSVHSASLQARFTRIIVCCPLRLIKSDVDPELELYLRETVTRLVFRTIFLISLGDTKTRAFIFHIATRPANLWCSCNNISNCCDTIDRFNLFA